MEKFSIENFLQLCLTPWHSLSLVSLPCANGGCVSKHRELKSPLASLAFGLEKSRQHFSAGEYSAPLALAPSALGRKARGVRGLGHSRRSGLGSRRAIGARQQRTVHL